MDPDILAALKSVVDPELGINIVDLGLVYGAARENGQIDVRMTMTTPSCPLGEMIVEEAKLALEKTFPDASSIAVELVWDPPWSADLMKEEARRQLGMN